MKKLIPFYIFILIFLFPTQAFAETKKIQPSLDTYITRTAPNATYSNEKSMVSFLDIPQQNVSMMLIKFPLDGIPQNATLKKAKLELYLKSATGADRVGLRVLTAADNWDSRVTWNNKPSSRDVIGTFISTEVDKTEGYKSWDITKIVQRWIEGTPNYGIIISGEIFDQSYNRNFATNEDNIGRHFPIITLEYTPAGGGFNLPGGNIIGNIPIGIINPVGNVGPNLNLLLISDIKTENITTTGVQVKWKTNKPSTSWVFYGDATDGVDRFDKQTGHNDSNTEHLVNLANLVPGKKYSIKVMSKDAENKQAYGSIVYITTLSNPGISSISIPTPQPVNNPISSLQESLENKVAEMTIESSLPIENIANKTPGSGEQVQEATLSASGPVSLVAGSVGISRLAGFLLIVLGLMSIIGALLLYFLTKKVHHHIRKRFSKKKK